MKVESRSYTLKPVYDTGGSEPVSGFADARTLDWLPVE